MKTLLLKKQNEGTPTQTTIRFSKVQQITFFIIILSLAMMYFMTPKIGCITLFSGIIFQLVHKFYRENIRPALGIANMQSEMSDIIKELG